MRSRLLLAFICSGIILAGVAVSGLFDVSLTTAAPLERPAYYDASCDWSAPDGYVPIDLVGMAMERCDTPGWDSQVAISVTSGISYVVKACVPQCNEPPSGSCCDDCWWDARVLNTGGTDYHWRSAWITETGGCGNGFTTIGCMECGWYEFFVPGDGELVTIYVQRTKAGMWYEYVWMDINIYPPSDGPYQLDWYYPLVYSDTLDVTQGFGGEHNGIDFSVTEGRPVFAVYTGTVETAGYTDVRGYYIEVDHGEVFETGADYLSRYDHLSAINVSVGEVVSGGCQIGWSGDTGDSTGPHLHLTIEEDGTAVDPEPFLELYPEDCRSCGAITNYDFLDGLTGWTYGGASWSASAWPNEGIVNLSASGGGGGYLRQILTLDPGTQYISVRLKAYNDASFHMVWGDMVTTLPVPGDGEWHVACLQAAGGQTGYLEIGADLDSAVIVVDWVCVAQQGQEDVIPPPPTNACNLTNNDFDDGSTGWTSSGATFAAGWVQLAAGGYISQTVTLAEPATMIRYIVKSADATTVWVTMGAISSSRTIPGGGTIYEFNLVPDSPITGTNDLVITNSGANPLDIDYVCVLTGETGPPSETDCDYLKPVGDWFNVGKWVEWLYCMLKMWLLTIWGAVIGIGMILKDLVDIVQYILGYAGPGASILSDVNYTLLALEGEEAYWLESSSCLLKSAIVGNIFEMWAIIQLLPQLLLDLLGLIVTGLGIMSAYFHDTPIGVVLELLYDLGADLVLILQATLTATTTLFENLNSSAVADLGLPDPNNVNHPLYAVWIGVQLLDDMIADTPLQYAVVIAMGAIGFRLIIWSITMLTDW